MGGGVIAHPGSQTRDDPTQTLHSPRGGGGGNSSSRLPDQGLFIVYKGENSCMKLLRSRIIILLDGQCQIKCGLFDFMLHKIAEVMLGQQPNLFLRQA